MNFKRIVGIDAHSIGLKQGGNETYIRELLRAISKIEHPEFEFLIFLLKNIPVPSFLLKKNFKICRISKNTFLRFGFELPLKTYINKPDLIHTQYHLPFMIPCPGVVTIHDVSFLRFPEYFPKDLLLRFKIFLPYSIKKSIKIITCSEFSKKEIINFYKVKPEKIVVIHYGVSENFKPVEVKEKGKILKKYGIKNSFILAVSNLQPRKNLKRLIKAYLHLLKNKDNFQYSLVIVGRKLWLYKEIFEEVRGLDLKDKIIFTDYIPEKDLIYLYNLSEVFVYPSLYEGFGLPVLEAMACGCPVITSNLSSLPEICEKAAILVNPYDIKAIANAINEVISNNNLRKFLKNEGLKQSQKFSWEKTAEKTLKVYEGVLYK